MKTAFPALLTAWLLAMPALAIEPLKTATPEAQPLGRLFMTPDRRAALDRQRLTNRQEALTAEGDVLTVNGTLIRSSGRTTQWVNQRPQHDGQHAPLKVGESENRITQERSDVVPPGAIRVRPSRP